MTGEPGILLGVWEELHAKWEELHVKWEGLHAKLADELETK